MATQWKEVVRLILRGPSFENHSIELSALRDISEYQDIVTETGAALWKADNPESNLPRGFKDALTLRLKSIEPGSTALLLEAAIEEEAVSLPTLEGPPPLVVQAVRLIAEAIGCAQEDKALPERFPKKVIPRLAEWGKDLHEGGNVIEVCPTGGRRVTYTQRERARILDFVEGKYEDSIDVTGTVLAADVKKNRFVIYMDPQDREGIEVTTFAPEDEALITEALKEHETQRLRVRGRGEFSPPEGRLRRIVEVSDLLLLRAGEMEFDPTARPIWEELIEIAEKVPEEELRKLPHDLSRNLDHYIYGTRRK